MPIKDTARVLAVTDAMRALSILDKIRTLSVRVVPVASVYIADVAGEAQLSHTSPGGYFLVPDGSGTLRINDDPTGAAMLVQSDGEVRVLT